MNCAIGDYVITAIDIEGVLNNPLFYGEIRMNITNGSNYKTIATTTGGGIYKVGDNGKYFVCKLEFIRPLSQSEYDTLKLDLSKSLVVNHDGTSNKTAWIRKTVRKLATGEMTWELISNLDNL